jgi:hypothetical protein
MPSGSSITWTKSPILLLSGCVQSAKATYPSSGPTVGVAQPEFEELPVPAHLPLHPMCRRSPIARPRSEVMFGDGRATFALIGERNLTAGYRLLSELQTLVCRGFLGGFFATVDRSPLTVTTSGVPLPRSSNPVLILSGQAHHDVAGDDRKRRGAASLPRVRWSPPCSQVIGRERFTLLRHARWQVAGQDLGSAEPILSGRARLRLGGGTVRVSTAIRTRGRRSHRAGLT